MSSHEIDEYEQGERVRGWLRDNGSSLLTGVALGLALIAGFKWYQGRGARHQEEASTQYATVLEAIEAKDATKARTFVAVLDDKYVDSPFAVLAHLRQAEALQADGKTADALAALRAAPPTKDPAIAELLKLRIARLQLIAGKADDALATVAPVKDALFPAALGELRGDAYLAKGQKDEARKAYEQALVTLDQAAPIRRLVELKLIEAGGKAPAHPEA